MEAFWQDVCYGLRRLVQRPGFTAVAVLTLALGIGANTAIFSLINEVLLNPLPFKAGERTFYAWQGPADNEDIRMIVRGTSILAWREGSRLVEGFEAYIGTTYRITGGAEPEAVRGVWMEPGMLDFLGVSPQLGRNFLPEEAGEGSEKVVLISHGLWQRRFAGQPDVLGRTILLNDKPHTVVGVLPPNFNFPTNWSAEVWAPMRLQARDRRFVLGRLKPGVTLEQAQSELQSLHSAALPGSDQVIDLRRDLVPPAMRSALWILMAAAGFVLLIACVNVANLMLAQGTDREKEVAIRAAVGAKRTRLIRQFLTESSLLAVAGAGLGVMVASGGVNVTSRLLPEAAVILQYVELSRPVLLFTLAVCFVATLIFGGLPALQGSRANLQLALKGVGRNLPSGWRSRMLRDALLVAEVALALLLLMGAGLMMNSLVRLGQIDPGFNPDKLTTMAFTLPQARYPDAPGRIALAEDLSRLVGALPGVELVTIADSVPPHSAGRYSRLAVEDPLVPWEDKTTLVYTYRVDEEYFRVMGIPLLRGRSFTAEDGSGASIKVIIAGQMAERFWPGADPIGKRIRLGDKEDPWATVVGVVGDVKVRGLRGEPEQMQLYFPFRQNPSRFMTVVARTNGDPGKLLPLLKAQLWSLDKDQPINHVNTARALLSESLAEPRFYTLLIGAFSGLAVVLAAVGVYGLISYSVSRRTHEIGVRMALGAQPGDILKWVVGRGLLLAGLGVAVGLVASFALTRFLSSMLYGVSATDLLTFAAVSLLLMTVAMAACYIPARRATHVDPMVALRYE